MDGRDEQVNRLLHDAQHASSGSSFAHLTGHWQMATELAEKAARLRREAEALDPNRKAPAWEWD